MSLDIEKAAELGFHLVETLKDGAVRFERVIASGTQRIEGKNVEEALTEISTRLATHPGLPSSVSSRSDGALESRDDQAAQSVAAGADGPSPAADAEATAAEEAARANAEAEAREADAKAVAARQAAEAEAPAVEEAAAPEAAAEAPVVES